jgi:hypothetical protein
MAIEVYAMRSVSAFARAAQKKTRTAINPAATTRPPIQRASENFLIGVFP